MNIRWAKGIPRYESTPEIVFPTNVPSSSVTVGAEARGASRGDEGAAETSDAATHKTARVNTKSISLAGKELDRGVEERREAKEHHSKGARVLYRMLARKI